MFDLIFLVLFFATLVALSVVPVYLDLGAIAGLQATALCVVTLVAVVVLAAIIVKGGDAWAAWGERRMWRAAQRRALARMAAKETTPDRGIV